MTTATLSVKSLPAGLQQALRTVSYKRADITVCAVEATHIADPGGAGIRGFACIMPSVESPTMESHVGSWGGPNMFGVHSPVDDMRAPPRQVPEGGAIITGTTGGGRPVSARVHVRPAVFATLVPLADEGMREVMADAVAEGRTDVVEALIAQGSPGAALTELQRAVLEVFWGIKGGHRARYLADLATDGRTERGARLTPPPGAAAVDAAVEFLVTDGYLKRSANGATALTTKGKNARSR